MKKKLIMAAVFVSALAITGTSAFAFVRHDRNYLHNNSCCVNQQDDECCPSVEVNADSNANVNKNIRTRGNSGDNFVSAGFLGSANLTSGNASAASAVSDTVEGSLVTVKAPDSGKVEINADSDANVTTYVRTRSNTGRNHVTSVAGGGATANTGSANSSSNSVTSVIGSTVDVE